MEEAFADLSEEAVELYLGSSVPTVDINDLSPLVFYREYVSKNKPVLIKNAFNHWPALHGKWSGENLADNMAGDTISVAVTPNGYADAITGGKFMLPDELQMTFTEFYKRLMTSADNLAVNPNHGQAVIYYIQKQNSNMTTEFKKLLPHVDTELSWATEAFGCSPDAVNFWMGDSRAVTSLHKDHYENIYCVVSGSKEFTLIPPTDQPFIPYVDAPVAQYRYRSGGMLSGDQPSADGSWEVVDDEEGRTVPWIPVDPLAPDLAKYPEFSRAHTYRVTVSRGEALYLPSLWYHHVSQSHACIAVNYWYDMQFDIKYNYYQLVSNLLKKKPLIVI